MLEQLDIGIDNALAYRVQGKVTKREALEAMNKARQLVSEHGDILVLKQIDSFRGFELGVVLEQIKYLYDVGLFKIKKVAILTDKKWLSKIVAIEDKLFKQIEMRAFCLNEMEKAVLFLKQGSKSAPIRSGMFIAMNRFKVKPGQEEVFLDIWRSRHSYLDTVPGFISFNMLHGPSTDAHTLFSSHVVWKSKDDFEAWIQSEAFKKAHAGAGGKKDIYVGPPQLECFTSVI